MQARVPHILANLPALAGRVLLSCLCVWSLTSSDTQAADNTATGSIGGVPGTLQSSATVSLTVNELTLIKEVRSAIGDPLPREASAGQGTVIWFVIYVNNDTSSALDDIQLEDPVAQGAGNFSVMELSSGVHAQAIDLANITPGNEQAALNAAWNNSWQNITDTAGDNANDLASGEYDSGSQTFRFGTPSTSAQVPPQTLRAYRIKVTVN